MDVHFCISTLQIAAGPYSLVAGVVFNGAAIASSAAVNITVTNLAPVLYNIRLTSGGRSSWLCRGPGSLDTIIF